MNSFVKKVSSMLPKLSPEHLEQVVASLVSQNNIFDSVMDSLSSGIILLDTEWKTISMNKAAERLLPFFSFSHEQIGEKYIWELIDDHFICEFLEKVYQQDSTNISDEFSFTLNEKTRFVTIKVLPFVKKSSDFDEESFDCSIAGSLITIDDITEKKQKEILSHRMESLRSLTNLAASVAHDIKNPLGAISIHIQLLQKSIQKARNADGMLPQEKFLENYLRVVNEEIENLNKIVLDFLFAVRPVQPEFSLCDADAVIEKTVNFFTPEFNSKNVKIECNLSSIHPRLLIDENLFKQMIINLSQNALYAIQERFGKIENVDLDKAFDNSQDNENSSVDAGANRGILNFESNVENEKYILTITDNGCGMDEKTVERVFEPYYTTKANGTGLGMTMVYKIIKEFNGEIEVSSVKGHGTSFTITLPVPQKSTMLLENK